MKTKVYFAARADFKYCKIGHSKNPERRLRELQTSNPEPLVYLGAIEGGLNEEKTLHECFRDLISPTMNEWFELRGALLAYLEMKGLVDPVYGSRDQAVVEIAKTARTSGWFVYSHEDLDLILREPRQARAVQYDCDRPRVCRGRAAQLLFS